MGERDLFSASLHEQRKQIRTWAKEKIVGEIVQTCIGKVHITMAGIKEVLNQPHRNIFEKNALCYQILELLSFAAVTGVAADTKGKCVRYFYLEIDLCNAASFIVIKETFAGELHLYTIVDHLKENG